MPDKWDSADGQTHDESELIATDAEIALWFNRLREAHDSISRESEWEPPDPSVVLALQAFEGCINRLDAAERELSHYRSNPRRHEIHTDGGGWEYCDERIDRLATENAALKDENALLCSQIRQLNDIIAAHIDKRIAMECDARQLVTVDAMERRVAEAVRPWRETLEACLPWLEKCPPLVQQINAMLSKEADRGTV